MRRINKAMLKSIIEYCIALLIILCNHCIYTRNISGGIDSTTLLIILVCACLFRTLLETVNSKVRLYSRYMVVIFFVVTFSFLSVVIPFYQVQAGLALYVFPMTAFILMFSICSNTKSIWNCFVNIMFIIALVALFFYLFGSILNIIRPSGIVRYTYNSNIRSCNSYYDLYFETQIFREQGLLNTNIRNCGIFIEAPMYNIMLSLALLAELSFRDRVRKRVVFVLIISIITTMTTTGIFVLVFSLIIRASEGGKKKFLKSLKIVIFPMLVLITIFIVITVWNNKLSTVQGEASYFVRLDHTIAFFKMFLHSPLFGYGYGNGEAFYSFAEYDQGYSMGLPALLGRCGGLMFSLYFVPWIKLTIHSFRGKRLLYFYGGSFIVLLLTAVVYQPIMYMIICMQLVENVNLKSIFNENQGIGVLEGLRSFAE